MINPVKAILFSAVWALLAPAAVAGTPAYETVWAFGVPPANPGYGSLVLADDGWYWGTTMAGGARGTGTIYRIKADGSDWQTMYSFGQTFSYPLSGLASDGAGHLWGTAHYPRGAVYKVNVTTRVVTMIKEFRRDGVNYDGRPAGLLYNDGQGYFWGTTTTGDATPATPPTTYNGMVFKVNIATGAFSVVADLALFGGAAAGYSPFAGLTSDGAGFLWGITERGGSTGYGQVFKVNMATGVFTAVASLPSNAGSYARGRLTADRRGYLWGTTYEYSRGGVFKVNMMTGELSSVLRFSGNGPVNKGANPQGELLLDDAGLLWGTTSSGGSGDGTVFKLDPVTGVLTTVVEFPRRLGDYSGPYAGLVRDGAGSFLGTTYGWPDIGPTGAGTVFKLDPASGAVTTLTNFVDGRNGGKGYWPHCGLVADGRGRLWGTSGRGGGNNRGTIFRIDPVDEALETVVDFGDYSPELFLQAPYAGLCRDTSGLLWGTTGESGVARKGSVFTVNPKTGELTSVAEFSGINGSNRGASPQGRLISDGRGWLYGTTQYGGASDHGTAFRVDAKSGTLTTLADFDLEASANNGGRPSGALCLDSAGWLWGATTGGGTLGNGSVFKLNPQTGEFGTVISFTGTAGANKGTNPYGSLAADSQGIIWGATSSGGRGGFDGGTIFQIRPRTGELTTFYEWQCQSPFSCDGNRPFAGLTPDGAGFLWGTTTGGGSYQAGTVFRIHSATGAYTKLAEFTGSQEAPSSGSLFLHNDGNLYGTTSSGGPLGGGTIYRIRNGPTPVTGTAETAGATATLNGTLHPHGTESFAFFEWGTDPALNVFQTLAAGIVPAGNGPRNITAVITGLVAGSTLYFRISGSNPDNAQMQRGSIKSFAVPSTLDAWRSEHFNTAVNTGIATDLADADGDGLVNLVEFAFGLNPRLADPHLMPAAAEADGRLILSFTRPPGVSGIGYAAEWSRTLQPGSWLPLPDSGVGATHEFRVPLTPDGNRFIRLKVIMEPSP